MFEKYTNDIFIEANCLLGMMETGVLPACAKDLKKKYENLPDDSPNSQARYAVDVVKPQMEAVRELSDAAERLVEADLWPFPKYSELLFHHQSGAPEEY